jgi:hypothetical protein
LYKGGLRQKAWQELITPKKVCPGDLMDVYMLFTALVLVDYFMASLIVASMVALLIFLPGRGKRGCGMFRVLHGWHDGSSYNER